MLKCLMNRNDYGGLKHSKQYHVWMTQHRNITLMYGTCLGQDYACPKQGSLKYLPYLKRVTILNCDMKGSIWHFLYNII